jgi:hypothetical protein
MAVLVNSFPIGIGIALLSLGLLAGESWAVGPLASAALAAAAGVMVALLYPRHALDGAGGAVAGASGLARQELTLVCLAGAMWGLWNGALGTMLGFTPGFLVATGHGAAAAGALVGGVMALMVVSIQAGGMIAQRWGHQGTLLLIGVCAWVAGLLAVRALPAEPVLGLMGLLIGLPVGVIMSLPALALRPENRALGMGIFFTWLYVFQAGVPPFAGFVQDVTRDPATAITIAAAVSAALLPLYAVFRRRLDARR